MNFGRALSNQRANRFHPLVQLSLRFATRVCPVNLSCCKRQIFRNAQCCHLPAGLLMQVRRFPERFVALGGCYQRAGSVRALTSRMMARCLRYLITRCKR